MKGLLGKNNIAIYWLGFLLADGIFYHNRIRVCLADKDLEHLKGLYSFLSAKTKITRNKQQGSHEFSVYDKQCISHLRQRFDIKDRKTYNPPSIGILTGLSDNQLTSLLIGYIDGDGHIALQTGRKDAKIAIKCHPSWSEFINKLVEILPQPVRGSVRGHGYFNINITHNQNVRFLKNKARALKLPTIKRKWLRIDEFRVSKTEKMEKYWTSIVSQLSAGKSKKEIQKNHPSRIRFDRIPQRFLSELTGSLGKQIHKNKWRPKLKYPHRG